MTISTRYIEKLNVVIYIGSEIVNIDDIVNAALDWEKHADFNPKASSVWDLVAADFEFDWQTIKDHGVEIAGHFESTRDSEGRNAWVVADDVTAIVLESVHFAIPWPTEWKTFHDADAAIEWVTTPRAS